LNYTARFIELASEVNTSMPEHWVKKVQDELNEYSKALKGSKILVLGAAYKKDISDVRESPALDIMSLLLEKGSLVEYHDPHVPSFKEHGMEMESVNDLDKALGEADCVVVVTDHSFYDWDEISSRSKLLVDTRHVTWRV